MNDSTTTKNHNSKTKATITQTTQILNYDLRKPDFTMSSAATAPKGSCDFSTSIQFLAVTLTGVDPQG